MRARGALIAAIFGTLALPAVASGYDPVREGRNYSKINERFLVEEANPPYQLEQLAVGMRNTQSLIERDVRERDRLSLNLCASGFQGCAGDVRTYDFQGRRGVQVPVVFANRNGALLEGHLWASFSSLERVALARARASRARACRAQRHRRASREPAFTGQRCPRAPATSSLRLPGVVVETGSVQAPERLYWWAPQVLARNGYLAMTFDVQGQGRSDTFGNPDPFAGVPAQQLEVFTTGIVDALDLFTSTAKRTYEPRSEAGSARQRTEVRRRRTTAFNPFEGILDRRRLGVAGHSLGAAAISVVQESDERIDAIVAWDNLNPGGTSGTGGPPSPPLRPRAPALGMSADYFLTPTPYSSDPDPETKNRGFNAWRAAGIDAMQLNIRGGTHYEWSYISNPAFGATLRGIDMAAWYTTAWFDRYVKRDPTAGRRLLTRRWLADAPEAAVDPEGDGNMFSFYFPSRAAFGGVACEDIRNGCDALVDNDGRPASPPYSALNDR